MNKSPRQEADGSTNATDKDSLIECPTCGDKLNTERGMKIHHTTVHNESIALEEKICSQCNEKYEDYKSTRKEYCSHNCLIESQRNQESNTCKHCGCSFESKPSYNSDFCSNSCYHSHESAHAKGEEHPQYTENVTVECEHCGQKYEEIPSREDRTSYCSRECYDQSLSEDSPFHRDGKAHPAWKGGHAEYYGKSWFTARREALEQYDYKCAICSKGKEELGRNPDVHHIIPFKKYDDHEQANKLTNLIVLCQKHHSMWEGLYLKPDIRDEHE